MLLTGRRGFGQLAARQLRISESRDRFGDRPNVENDARDGREAEGADERQQRGVRCAARATDRARPHAFAHVVHRAHLARLSPWTADPVVMLFRRLRAAHGDGGGRERHRLAGEPGANEPRQVPSNDWHWKCQIIMHIEGRLH